MTCCAASGGTGRGSMSVVDVRVAVRRLTSALDVFADVKIADAVVVDRTGWPIEQRLAQRNDWAG